MCVCSFQLSCLFATSFRGLFRPSAQLGCGSLAAAARWQPLGGLHHRDDPVANKHTQPRMSHPEPSTAKQTSSTQDTLPPETHKYLKKGAAVAQGAPAASAAAGCGASIGGPPTAHAPAPHTQQRLQAPSWATSLPLQRHLPASCRALNRAELNSVGEAASTSRRARR